MKTSEEKKEIKPSERILQLINDFYDKAMYQPSPEKVKIDAIVKYLDEQYDKSK